MILIIDIAIVIDSDIDIDIDIVIKINNVIVIDIIINIVIYLRVSLHKNFGSGFTLQSFLIYSATLHKIKKDFHFTPSRKT